MLCFQGGSPPVFISTTPPPDPLPAAPLSPPPTATGSQHAHHRMSQRSASRKPPPRSTSYRRQGVKFARCDAHLPKVPGMGRRRGPIRHECSSRTQRKSEAASFTRNAFTRGGLNGKTYQSDHILFLLSCLRCSALAGGHIDKAF